MISKMKLQMPDGLELKLAASIQSNLDGLNKLLQRRANYTTSHDSLYLAGNQVYLHILEMTNIPLSQEEVCALQTCLTSVVAVMKERSDQTIDQLALAIKDAPLNRSSNWAKLGAGLLFLFGMAIFLVGCLASPYTAGASLFIAFKITGALFAAAGALWGVRQYHKVMSLKKSLSHFFEQARLQKSPLSPPKVETKIEAIYHYLENNIIGNQDVISKLLKTINRETDEFLKNLLLQANNKLESADKLLLLLRNDIALCQAIEKVMPEAEIICKTIIR